MELKNVIKITKDGKIGFADLEHNVKIPCVFDKVFEKPLKTLFGKFIKASLGKGVYCIDDEFRIFHINTVVTMNMYDYEIETIKKENAINPNDLIEKEENVPTM